MALMSDTGKEEATVSMHDGLTKGAICSSFLMKGSPLYKGNTSGASRVLLEIHSCTEVNEEQIRSPSAARHWLREHMLALSSLLMCLCFDLGRACPPQKNRNSYLTRLSYSS